MRTRAKSDDRYCRNRGGRSLLTPLECRTRSTTDLEEIVLFTRHGCPRLFGDIDPVGQSIRIKNVPLTVVGVLDPKGQSPTGQDQDDVILLPISTAKRKVIGIKSANADAVDSIVMEAGAAVFDRATANYSIFAELGKCFLQIWSAT